MKRNCIKTIISIIVGSGAVFTKYRNVALKWPISRNMKMKKFKKKKKTPPKTTHHFLSENWVGKKWVKTVMKTSFSLCFSLALLVCLKKKKKKVWHFVNTATDFFLFLLFKEIKKARTLECKCANNLFQAVRNLTPCLVSV